MKGVATEQTTIESTNKEKKIKVVITSHSSLEDSRLMLASKHLSIDFVQNDMLTNLVTVTNNVTRLIMKKEGQEE